MPTVYYASVFDSEDTLVRQSDLIDEDFVQNKCPVFNHKQSRTFVATSPIDFNLEIDRTPGRNHIICSRPELLEYDDEHLNSPRPVIQLVFPKFLFKCDPDTISFKLKYLFFFNNFKRLR